MNTRTAWPLFAIFVVLIGIPPIHQTWREWSDEGHVRLGDLFDDFPTSASLKSFEEALARDSHLGGRARAVYQELLVRAIGQGSEKIVVGRDDFLFFRKEVEMTFGDGFLHHGPPAAADLPTSKARPGAAAAVDAVRNYHTALAARGVRLVFAPIPVKPFIHPERLWSGYPRSNGPALNPDHRQFVARLREAGVDVFDVTDALWAVQAQNPGGSLYLARDTHWTPEGLAVAADAFAAHLRQHLPAPTHTFTTATENVAHDGDLLRMLEIPGERSPYPRQAVTIEQVLDQGKPVGTNHPGAALILLGDSFTNVYSRPEMSWGQGAGLGEQLMLRLGQPVHVIATNGQGATGTRETLFQQPAALAAARVILWTCSMRDFQDPAVSWDIVPLPDDPVRP